MDPLDPSLPLGGTMERGAADAAPPPVVLLVLQVSPLPGSTDREEYFYEASPDDRNGPFAAARALFSVQGHVVAIHDCPDISAFQAVRPFGLVLRPLANLPSRVFVEGSKALQALALAATPVPAAPAAGAPQEGAGFSRPPSWIAMRTSLWCCCLPGLCRGVARPGSSLWVLRRNLRHNNMMQQRRLFCLMGGMLWGQMNQWLVVSLVLGMFPLA
jgi:hypothetical protein